MLSDFAQEWGLRIQEWILEARDGGEWRELPRGTTMGPGRRIDVRGTTARELRLRLPRATVTPTISELAVFRFARE
jgi:alpha-L-fucosidase